VNLEKIGLLALKLTFPIVAETIFLSVHKEKQIFHQFFEFLFNFDDDTVKTSNNL
jgi:hypothetical protein